MSQQTNTTHTHTHTQTDTNARTLATSEHPGIPEAGRPDGKMSASTDDTAADCLSMSSSIKQLN